ncbi:MAG: T9SS type A sorting domain-containing protein [Bacteroidales bacterium]
MKYPLRLIVWMLIASCISAVAQNGPSATLTLKNGTQHPFALSSIQKISFANSSLLLNYRSASPESFSLVAVGAITFSNLSAIRPTIFNSKISLYPNPVSDFVSLRNLPEGNNVVTIYRNDGASARIFALSATDKTVDLSQLASGFYLLKVNNQVIKFVKR